MNSTSKWLIIRLASEVNALNILFQVEICEFLKHSKTYNNVFLKERTILRQVCRLYAKLDLTTFEVLKEVNLCLVCALEPLPSFCVLQEMSVVNLYDRPKSLLRVRVATTDEFGVVLTRTDRVAEDC